MSIHVRFFASLRERLALDDLDIALPDDASVAGVWRCATANAELPPNLLIAVNQDYAALDAPVRDGDEVAFFPPVTGG